MNTKVEALTEAELMDIEGGELSCNQLFIMGGAAIGGVIAGAYGTPFSAPVGAFLGGIAGSFAADYFCE